MIPKPLNEIIWADIESLRDSGQEEDDTIEYKTSFSGGSDFLAFSESQRIKAVDAIAKEAIAFLNGRGGDIIIGAKEAANDHPRIEVITPVANVDATSDRLGQALAALIEPTQSVLSVRAVRKSEDATDGVLIVRAPSSLRAPHRSKRTKECYVRRGRESVPMPMDEVQDLTIRRSDTQADRFRLLDKQFSDFGSTKAGRHVLHKDRIHFRSCFLPLNQVQISLEEDVTATLQNISPTMIINNKAITANHVFSQISSGSYRPVLRGMAVESFRPLGSEDGTFWYVSKTIYCNGILVSDFACRLLFRDFGSFTQAFLFEWVADYFANVLVSMSAVQKKNPVLADGVFRVGIHSGGATRLKFGQTDRNGIQWPTDTLFIPDFECSNAVSLPSHYEQLQIDVASIAGVSDFQPYVLSSQP